MTAPISDDISGDGFFDSLEQRSTDERETALFKALRTQLANAKLHAPGYAAALDDVDPDAVCDREALAAIALTRKSSLVERQLASPPFAGLSTVPVGELARVFSSPGPIYEPQTHDRNFWRLARALYAAGIRRGDLVHNTFSYHFTPAGAMLEDGAHALGCAVFPAGVGQTDAQLQAITMLRPQAYTGTPSFLKILLDKGAATGMNLSSLTKALVSGEALPPSLRSSINAAGVRAQQCYATADLGLIGYESPAMEGLIVDEEVIVEIVRPGTGDVVAPGDVGEVVVTTLNPQYPLIRFATGDLSAILPGASPCGRTNMRLLGWMGRADQTTKVKGMFVHPAQVAQVLKRHAQVTGGRLVVGSENNQDVMTLQCETAAVDDASLSAAIKATLREVCKVGGTVTLVATGSLANDGKVIDDQRSYE